MKRIVEARERDIARIEARRLLNLGGAGLGGRGGRGGGGGIDGGGFGYRMGYWAMRNFAPVTPMLSYAGRLAGSLARGAGVNFDMGGMVGKQVELEKLYTQLSSQGYQENGPTAAARTRQNPATMQAEGMAIAKQFGLDPEEVARATTKFVDLTGNLEGARAAMAGLARLSNATGSDLTDMASAAASVQVQLDRAMGDDVQGKAKSLTNIMRIFSGQGKMGAVEIKDFAAQMAKVATITNKFAGSREDVFASVGVLAQESRKAGGSASASQAATSVSRFASMLTQSKVAGNFAAQGINVFADKGKTQLRNPEEIILEALRKTRGSAPAMQGLFKNIMANRAVEGFTNIFNTTKTGTGKGGVATIDDKLRAVAKEFDDLKRAALTEKEEADNNAAAMATAAKKAQVFQNQLQEVVGSMAQKLLPAMEQLAPKALMVVDVFSRLVSWAAGNPFEGIVTLLGASILKSGIEQTIRGGIEQAFTRAAGGGGGGAIGAAGTLAAGLVIASAAFTVVKIGDAYIDHWFANAQAEQKEAANANLAGLNAEAGLQAGRKAGVVSPEAAAAAKAALARNEAAIKKEEEPDWVRSFMNVMGKIDTFTGDKQMGEEEQKGELEHRKRLESLQEEHNRLLKMIATSGINIKSLPDTGPTPHVDDSARAGSNAH